MGIQAKRADVREVILDSVDVLLGRYGFKKMTIEDVARDAGIGKGTVYLHFSSKEELVLSHIDRIVDRVLTEMHAIAGQGGDAFDRLRRILVMRVMKRCEAVRHYQQSLNDLLVGVREQLLAHRNRHFKAEASVIAELLISELRFEATQAEELALTMVFSTNAFLPYNLTLQELGKKQTLQRSVESAATLLVAGVRAMTTEMK